MGTSGEGFDTPVAFWRRLADIVHVSRLLLTIATPVVDTDESDPRAETVECGLGRVMALVRKDVLVSPM